MKKIFFIHLVFIFFLAKIQAQNVSTDSITGTWKGTSICQVKSSPCHDEIAVYHISKTGKPNEYQFVMNKLVNGKEEDMGIINYSYDSTLHEFTGKSSPIAIWKFEVKVKAAKMEGTLVYNNVLYRIIHLEKQ